MTERITPPVDGRYFVTARTPVRGRTLYHLIERGGYGETLCGKYARNARYFGGFDAERYATRPCPVCERRRKKEKA